MKALLILLFAAFLTSCVAEDVKSKDAFMSFWKRKDYKGGVTAFERELATQPNDVALLVGLGQLHYMFEKYTEAKAVLDRALAIAPNHSVAHNFMGMLHSQTGQQTAALKELDLAIKSDPKYGEAHYNRAIVLITSSPPNKPEARESYKRALSLGCDSDVAIEQLLK